MTTATKRKYMTDTLFIAFIAFLIYFTLKYLIVWLLPFVIGFIVALILQSPINFLTAKTGIPRALLSFLLVFFIMNAIFALIGFIAYRLYLETTDFVVFISDSAPEIKNAFNNISLWYSDFLNTLPNDLSDIIQNSPAKLIDKAISYITGFISSSTRWLLVNIPAILLTTVLSVVASFFMTNDYKKITRFILLQFNEKNRSVICNAKRLFLENILKMLRGYLFIMFITFLELIIGFTVLKLDYAIVLALIIAFLDILPVVGTGTALIPWSVISLFTGNTYMGIGLIIIYIFITIFRNIIEPKIIGRQVGLPPLVTLIAMYLGLKLFGFVGLFTFPILIIITAKLQENGMIRIWRG